MLHRIEFILFQFFKWIVLALPLKSASRLGAMLGGGAYYIIGGRRRIALDNLRMAFPEKTEQERTKIAKGAFRNFGIMFVEMLWFPNLTEPILAKLVTYHNVDIIPDAEDRQKGIVLVTAHFANWELGGLLMGKRLRSSMLIIVQTQTNKLVDKVINEHRCLFGNRVVPTGMSVREIIRTLEQHGAVAMAADQSAAKESVHVEFFGRKVATHEGPAVFSLRTGAALILFFFVRKPDYTYDSYVELISLENLPEDREERVIALTQRHTKVLEKYIRQYPDQWLWLHRRWKHVEETSPDA